MTVKHVSAERFYSCFVDSRVVYSRINVIRVYTQQNRSEKYHISREQHSRYNILVHVCVMH